MIVNNTIILPPFASPIENWHPSNPTQNSLYIASLTTLLSYQLTAIAFDLLHGFQPRNQTTAVALQARLLAISPSPLGLLSTVCRKDRVDRLRFPNLPPGNFPRNDSHIHTSTLLMLIALVSTPFIANLVAVFISTERDRPVPFSRTHFTGLALGFGKPIKGDREWQFGRCHVMPFVVPPPYKPRVEFIICRASTDWTVRRGGSNREAELSVEVFQDASIVLTYLKPARANISEVYSAKMHAGVRTDLGFFRIGHGVNERVANKFINAAKRRIPFKRIALSKLQVSRKKGSVKFFKTLKVLTKKQKRKLKWRGTSYIGAMAQHVTLVPTTNFRLAVHGREEFQRFDVPLVERRGRVIGEGVLALVVIIAIVIRVLVKVLAKNDVEVGMGCLLKRFIESDNLLWNDTEVRYDFCYVVNHTILYGMERRGLREFTGIEGNAANSPHIDNFENV